MTTHFVGLKEFRQNMAKISIAAQKRNERLIVLRKNQPIFELRPLSESERVIERLMADIAKARRDVKNKKVYSLSQLKKELGI